MHDPADFEAREASEARAGARGCFVTAARCSEGLPNNNTMETSSRRSTGYDVLYDLVITIAGDI